MASFGMQEHLKLLVIAPKIQFINISRRSNMVLVSVCDFEKRAGEILPRNPWHYYQSGAEKQLTLELNKTAYDR